MSERTQVRGFARNTKLTVALRFEIVHRNAVLLILLIGLTHPAYGQNGGTFDSIAADVAGEQKTAAVPTSEITVLAAAESINLQRIEKLSESPDAYSWLSPAVADEERAIALLLGELDQIDTTRISTRALEDQRHQWREHQDQQARWLIDLNARWRSPQAAREDLERIRERWQLTRDAPSWQELPEELRQNVIEIIDQVEPLREKTQERATQFASVLGRLIEAQQHTSDALGRLDAISDSVNERLLRQDAQPLWRLHDVKARELLDSVQPSGRRWAEEVTQFVETHPTVLLVHLLLLVGLLAATLVARHSSRSLSPSEAKFARARFVASRPYAVAFVLSILAVPSLYGSGPASVRDVFGFLLIVPNSDLVSKEITNWTRSDPVIRVDIRVGVAYGSDVEQVIAVLRQVAYENSRVLETPEALPLMVGFGESSLDFQLLCWTRDEYRLEVVSELHLAVDAALRNAGIEIPFPQRDLHVKSDTAPLVSSSTLPDGETLPTRSDGPHETVRKVRR